MSCCVLSGRGLCDALIPHPEESCRLWCVMYDLETSWMRRPWPTGGCCAKKKKRPFKHIILRNVSDFETFRFWQLTFALPYTNCLSTLVLASNSSRWLWQLLATWLN
jgi:hypothetical protein